jgi:threonine dehydratase
MRAIASTFPRSTVAPMPLEQVHQLAQRFSEAGLREVPLVRAPDLDRRADSAGNVRVWLALEALQTTGSFKVRGALVALDAIRTQRGRGARVVAASAGNHGAGVAYAARVLDLSATIVMPQGVPGAKRARIAGYGASVVIAASDHYDDAETEARILAAETGAAFVSPYDDLDVVAGNGASLGFEIVRAMGGVPDVTLTPFGGGGLATGLAYAFADQTEGCKEAPSVWGVQSEASPAMALSLERGEAIERLLVREPTMAEGLEGGISQRAFERAREAIAGVIVANEAEIGGAMTYAYREIGLVLEGSAAVALAPLLYGVPEVVRASRGGEETDLVVVLTGRNVDCERLSTVSWSRGLRREWPARPGS